MSYEGAFSALRHRDFRLFSTGQMISLMGTWMQNVGQAWLVLTLTNSPFQLGLVSAAQFLPVLLVTLFAGVVIDRASKRNLLLVTQVSLMLLALTLAILVSTGLIRYWHIVLLALGLGLVNAFDMPVRQSYVFELVGGRDDLMNAIALNSSIFNVARIVGPALAGLVMGTWGPGAAFYLNAASFVAVIWGLLLIPARPPQRATQDGRLLEHLKEGLLYVGRVEKVGGPLILLGVLSTFAMNFNVLVPVYAKSVLHQSARGYGLLMSFLGAGALVGALSLAGRARRGPDPRLLLVAGAGLGLFQLLLAGVKDYVLAGVVLALMGWSMITFISSVNSTIQLTVPDELRGRVMSLYSLLLAGVTPLGALFAGGLADRFGAPVSLALAGIIGLAASAAALAVFLSQRRKGQDPAPQH